jgi:hypothetical protein
MPSSQERYAIYRETPLAVLPGNDYNEVAINVFYPDNEVL